jgi:hypothetical protein
MDKKAGSGGNSTSSVFDDDDDINAITNSASPPLSQNKKFLM